MELDPRNGNRGIRLTRRVALFAVSIALLALGTPSGWRAAEAVTPSGRMAGLPRLTVWVWERREDLRGLDPGTTAVAYLDRTILVDPAGVHVLPRRQGMLLPASDGLVRIAVVRIESRPGAVLDTAAAGSVARDVVDAAERQSVAALQVDFDARQSEREWYTAVLQQVRAQMPRRMPLSITALASWCSYDGEWMHRLPVDEAVPMLFRMEPDRRRAGAGPDAEARDFALREPLCRGSIGISSRENWPRNTRDRRVYIFADRGWSRDGLEETIKELQ